jgi:hypothetical protein
VKHTPLEFLQVPLRRLDEARQAAVASQPRVAVVAKLLAGRRPFVASSIRKPGQLGRMQVEERGKLGRRRDRRHGPAHAAHRSLREQPPGDSRSAGPTSDPLELETEPRVELAPPVGRPVAIGGKRPACERPEPARLPLRRENAQPSLFETRLVPRTGEKGVSECGADLDPCAPAPHLIRWTTTRPDVSCRACAGLRRRRSEAHGMRCLVPLFPRGCPGEARPRTDQLGTRRRWPGR